MNRLITAAYFTVFLIGLNALSIEKVSDKQNVTKREANGDFFPDWVPFKNKHGEELGEFKSVPKAKPKKRLAPPVNFILRAVAEPEGDDYYDKGQGESDGDDYFEKKDWSDLSRPVDPAINHTDISEINGLVDIITKGKPNQDIIINAISNTNIKNKKSEDSKEVYNETVEEEAKTDANEAPIKEKIKEVVQKYEPKEKRPKKYEDDVDYEESDSEKKKTELTEEEQRDNDARKAKILDSVDELKERHAKEQKAISERAKEEEISEEDHERNYSKEKRDKYEIRGRKKSSDYEEYDDNDVSVQEKYRVNPFKTTTTTKRPKKNKGKKKEEVSKLSVFKNPQLYMVYDEETEETTTTKKPTTKARTKSVRISSRYNTSPSESDENVRISLVPQDEAKEGEPALFFPKTRKNKKRRKNKATTPAPDSLVAETVEEVASKDSLTYPVTASGIVSTGFDTGPSGLETAPSGPSPGSSGTEVGFSGSDVETKALSGLETALSGPRTGSSGTAAGSSGPDAETTALGSAPASDAVSTNSDTVIDAVPASTDHKDEKKQEDFHNEKGGGREHHSEHSEEHAEHGKKAYEGVHEDSKTAKGHHDKEDHHGQYHDQGGHDKKHHEESGHYGDHEHEEHGKKNAKYEESGKHSKGHSTKGSHDIHKKEEYEKKVEFFEEEGDSGEEEKHHGYHNERGHKEGGHFKKGDHEGGHQEHHKGDSGHFQKGGFTKGHKEYRSAGGHDNHGKHHQAKFQKNAGAAGKKWVYHHGHPAKTANLVVIDRRADQYYHGPQYYG